MTEVQRRADWFELFFDLVFVVTVSILASELHGEPGWGQYGTVLALFFAAWWAWVNLMLSVDVFADRWTRTLLLLAMPALAVMAAAAPAGLGSRSWAFALGAAWVRLVTFVIWWTRTRTAVTSVPGWRPIAYCLLTAGLWAVSAAVPAPWRYGLWALSIGIEIAILSWRRGQEGLYERLAPEHLMERIGLFLVIVLGESVFGVVTALAANFTWPSATAALGGLVIAAMLAIGFFRWVSPAAEEGFTGAQGRGAYEVMREAVMYLPFVLVSAVMVLAAALTQAVSEPTQVLPTGHRYGLSIGIAGFYLANAAITWRVGADGRDVLRWAVPSIVLALAVVLPIASIAPASIAVVAGALVSAAIVGLGRLIDGRRLTRTRI